MMYFAIHTGAFSGWVELKRRAKDLQGRIDIHHYETLLARSSLPGRTTVLSDHERFTPSQVELATHLWDTLREADIRCFNDPRKVLNRPRLLDALHEAGINDFRAYFPDAIPEVVRYPVFVRETHEHTGNLTRLLYTRAQLEWNLKLLMRFGGYRPRELLVVEHVDVSDAEGIYRKYAAFRVGDWVFPRYVEFARRWMIKADARLIRPDLLKEEMEFMHTNPHRRELMEIFELAGIDYGRIDYGVKDGRIQVWEINTNAQVGPRPQREGGSGLTEEDKKFRAPATEMFHDAFRDRLRELITADEAHPREDVPWRLDPVLVRRIRRETAALNRRLKVQAWLTQARRAGGLRKIAAALAGRAGK